jgi:hypothetical protein
MISSPLCRSIHHVWFRNCPPPRLNPAVRHHGLEVRGHEPGSASRSERLGVASPHCSAARTIRWNVQSTPRAGRNSPRPTCRSSDPDSFYISSWTAQFVFQTISERDDAGEHGEPFAWFDFLPQFFLHLRELAVRFQLVWQAAGLAMFYFEVPLSRESDDRLEAKIDRLLSEQRIDPAQLDYHEEEGVQG